MTPPRLSRWLLGVAACRDDRHDLIAGLDAEFARRASRDGAAAARAWYRHQAWRSAAPLIGWRGRRAGAALADFCHDLQAIGTAAVRRPGLVVPAVALLAIGTAAALAMAAIADLVLIRPLPYPDPDRLVLVAEAPMARAGQSGVAPRTLIDLRDRGAAFAIVGARYPKTMTFGVDGTRDVVTGALATEAWLNALGVAPALGRAWTREDMRYGTFDSGMRPTTAGGPVVLSHRFWQQRFGSDTGVIGRAVDVDGQRMRIAAVMPPAFSTAFPDDDVLVPWDVEARAADSAASREARFLTVVARLRDDVEVAAVAGRLTQLAAALAIEHPGTNGGWTFAVTSLSEVTSGRTRPAVAGLGLATLAAFALVVANVTSLRTAGASARAADLAIRQALGASRARLMRLLAIESVAIATGAAAIGAGLTSLALPALMTVVPAGIRIQPGSAIGPVTLLTALGLTTAAAFALWIATARTALPSAGRFGQHGHLLRSAARPARRWLAAGQVAFALPILVTAALVTGSLAAIDRVDLGFAAADRAALRVSLDVTRFDTADRRVEYVRSLEARLASLPGVAGVGGTTVLPLAPGGTEFSRPFWPSAAGRPQGSPPAADIRMVTPGYFEAIGTTVSAGRSFAATDRLGQPRVVVINRALADAAWPAGDAVGDRLVLDYVGGIRSYEVVGVVADTRYAGARAEVRPEVFVPYFQNPYPALHVVVRGGALTPADVQRVATALDPAQPVQWLATLDDLIARSVHRERLAAALMQGLGALALLIAVAGVYGTTAGEVAARRRELGLRAALGARPGQLLAALCRQALAPLIAGVGAGGVLAWWLARSLDAVLFRTPAWDPVAWSSSLALLIAAGAVAAFLPGVRAMRADPLRALRSE